MTNLHTYLKYIPLAIVLFSSGCTSLGHMTRYDAHGQQIICWTPSTKVNGLVTYVADKIEADAEKQTLGGQ